MFRQILLAISTMIFLVYISLFREFNSLPSLKTTLGHLLSIPYTGSLLIIVFILFPLPLVTVVFVLSYLKKFVFNHIKSISKCYNRAVYLLLISYSILTLLNCTSFLFDLAFKEHYYFIVRISYLLSTSHYPHTFTINLLIGLIIQSSVYSMAFLITEIILTFKFKVTSIQFGHFITRNLPSIVFTVMCFFCNIIFLIWLESRFFNFSTDHYYRTFEILDKIIESTLVTAILMYLYTILALYEN